LLINCEALQPKSVLRFKKFLQRERIVSSTWNKEAVNEKPSDRGAVRRTSRKTCGT
jgi:hypothetical protein